jgi:hypothetical protein
VGNRICSIKDCGKAIHGRGLCRKHYCRWQRHGDAEAPVRVVHEGDVIQRFWSKVDKSKGCWTWKGAVNKRGYGHYSADGKDVLAHRFSYQLVTGVPIPDGMQLDHRCHNPGCVNPEHLRMATALQNNENYQPKYTQAKSGVRGVDWHASSGMWRARVQHKGKCVYSQLFRNLEDARAAAIENRKRFHTFNDADRAAK